MVLGKFVSESEVSGIDRRGEIKEQNIVRR